MKTTKSIIVVLFVLLTAQIASAYYCPSTGRWLSRDPIAEPGFQALQSAAQAPIAVTSSRWINRDRTVDVSISPLVYKNFRGGRNRFYESAAGNPPAPRPVVKASTEFIDYQFCHNDPTDRFDIDGRADIPGCGFWAVQISGGLLLAGVDWVIMNRECSYLADHPGQESFGTTPLANVLTIVNIAAVIDHCPQGGRIYMHVWFDDKCNCKHNYVIICDKCSPGA